MVFMATDIIARDKNGQDSGLAKNMPIVVKVQEYDQVFRGEIEAMIKVKKVGKSNKDNTDFQGKVAKIKDYGYFTLCKT